MIGKSSPTWLILVLCTPPVSLCFLPPIPKKFHSGAYNDLSAKFNPQEHCNSRRHAYETEGANNLLDQVDAILSENILTSKYKQMEEEILAKTDASHGLDVDFCASLGSEGLSDQQKAKSQEISDYEWVYVKDCDSLSGGDIPLAIRTLGEPLLDTASVSIIREAAQSWWDRKKLLDSEVDSKNFQSTKSRFTYSRKGNYEAHLVDLANNVDGRIRTIAMDMLGQKIYPLVRDAFHPHISDLDDLDFCVYDSLVIRYNSTEAKDSFLGASIGANQPLHRDLGLVSVNIMLNPATEFEGGGTFFESQLRSELTKSNTEVRLPMPQKPSGVGHGLVHLSNERHAGAGTTAGVRDILVLFLTARSKLSKVPLMERAARLKSNARPNCSECETVKEEILCRIIHHRLAVLHNPVDGEAWHYLGTALREYANSSSSPLDIMQLSILCLDQAVKLIPCDGRLYNNLGLTFEKMIPLGNGGANDELARKHYEKSILIHKFSEEVGCDVSSDFDAVSLNYGLYISVQNEFDKAAKILHRLRSSSLGIGNGDIGSPEHRVIYDGVRLLEFCENQIR